MKIMKSSMGHSMGGGGMGMKMSMMHKHSIDIGEEKKDNSVFLITFKPREKCGIHIKVHEFY